MAAADTTSGYERYNRAYQMCVEQGMSLEKVSEETHIPLSTLKNWSSKDGWVEDKNAMQSSLQEVTRAISFSQKKLCEKARNGDLQSVFGLLKIRREMRHQTDANSVIAETFAALMAALENGGHSEAAAIVEGYMQAVAEKVGG